MQPIQELFSARELEGFNKNMGILERTRRYLDTCGDCPWPLGIDEQALPEDILKIWRTLSTEERLAISRHNPFLTERNKALVELKMRGLSQPILVGLSGLSIQSIKRITGKAKKE